MTAASAARAFPSSSSSPSSTSASSVPAHDLEVLLPPGYTFDTSSANRIADLSGTASFGIAMPNLRPLREAKNESLFTMKFGSVFLLSFTVGAILVHNAQLTLRKNEAGIDAVADSTQLGYGFGYGYEYGYEYGYSYGHVYGDDELTLGRGRAMMMAAYSDTAEKEKWSESSNVGKRALSRAGVGLKGVWDALPSY